MPLIKHYILAIFMLCSLSIFSQDKINKNKYSQEEKDNYENNIVFYIGQADLDIGRGNYYVAIDNLNKGLELATDFEDKKYIGRVNTELAKVHFSLENYDKAISALNKAVEIQRITKDYVNLAETHNVQGLVFAKKGEHKAAIDYYKSSKGYCDLEDLEQYTTEVLLNSSQSYIALKEYKKASFYLEQSIALSKKHNKKDTESAALISLGKAHYFLKDYNRALNKTKKGLELAKSINYQKAVSDASLVLSDIYLANKSFEESNIFLRSHMKLKDSINAALNNDAVSENILSYQDKDTQELLKKRTEELAKEKKSASLTQLTTLLSIALITILSLLTLSLYKNNNIRSRTNNMLYKKNEDLIIAKEKAELASKTKANFLSTVTHELRTPLYAVTGLTNMLLDEEPKPAQVQHLKSLKFSGEYLLAFINDILQLNKIEAEKVNLEPEVFNLKTKIENVISALNNSALDNNVKIHLEYSKEVPEVFNADQVKISQILMNLIGNSIKFTKDGNIWVRVNKIDNQDLTYNLKFQVEDDGIGITPEKQEHLFESFSQGSIQINRKYGGTGLGLSIVKGLMDLLKGRIYLDSTLGKGTTFIFELPLKHTKEKVKTKKEDYFKDVNEVDLNNIKILVVEDNKINQMITKKILNKMKLNCDVVDNGEDAVDKVKTENYDVVLMDIHMPGISGIEATKIIRTFDKEITIFALTAVTLEDKMQEFDEAGFDDIISKPFKQEDFEKKLFNELIGDKQVVVKS